LNLFRLNADKKTFPEERRSRQAHHQWFKTSKASLPADLVSFLKLIWHAAYFAKQNSSRVSIKLICKVQ